MKINILLLSLVFVSAMAFVPKPKSSVKKISEEKSIQWLSIEEAEEKCKKKPRKIFVDVYTSWCGWCKHMDATVFTNPAIIEYLNDKYYAVKLNAEDKNNIIFKESLFKYNERYKSNDLAVNFLNGNMSYPSFVFLDEDLTILSPVPGALKANEMDQLLHYFGENKFRKMKFEEYKLKYKSNLEAN